ncbi:MAG TPA: hypothetical protein VFG87_04735 [Amycolatopsis sp.]|nr:hypothetical protein [Amycolatopsis sp.]
MTNLAIAANGLRKSYPDKNGDKNSGKDDGVQDQLNGGSRLMLAAP